MRDIQFPLKAVHTPGARFAHIVDSAGRVIIGGGTLEDTEQLVAAANAGAQIQHAQPLEKQPRRKNKRQQIADDLKDSDPLAVIMERQEIVYGLHDELPQAGESVARLRK